MNIQKALVTYLQAHGDVSALIGTRIYPLVLQGEVFPAIVYQLISSPKEREYDGDVSFRRSRIQISCWSKSHSKSQNLLEVVEAALKEDVADFGGAGDVTISTTRNSDFFDDVANLYRASFDVEILHN